MFETSTETKPIGKVIVLNSEGGVGKSSIMGSAVLEAGEKGICISLGEDGITPLKNDKAFVNLSGINHLTQTVDKWAVSPLEAAKHKAAGTEPKAGFIELTRWLAGQKYDVIGLDSLTCLIPVLREYCMKTYFFDCPEVHGKSDGGFKSEVELRLKAEGFGESELIAKMALEWNKLIKALTYLREHGTDVWITTHRATKKGREVGVELDYDFSFINAPMNKNFNLGEDLYNTADAFLYGRFDHTIAKGAKGKGKLVGSGDRIFVTEGTPSIKAKNRFGMPEEIEATYETVKEYLK